MNIYTGEVKELDALTPAERASGHWIKLPKGYVPKKPRTAGDKWRIERAHAKRVRRAERRSVRHG